MYEQDQKEKMNKGPIAFPNIWQAFIILVALLMMQIALYFVFTAFGLTVDGGENLVGVSITLLSCAGVVAWSVNYMQITWFELFTPSEHANSFMSLLIILGGPLILVCAGAMVWITDLTNILIFFYPPSSEEIELISNMVDDSFWSLFAICIVAPFVEEIIFRGIILRGFIQHYPLNYAILLSSLLFALFHMTVLQFPTAFILGCLFAWLYVKTRSLWPCIIGHFINNSLALLFYYSSDNQELVTDTSGPILHSPLLTIAALCVSAYGMYLLDKVLNPRPHSDK